MSLASLMLLMVLSVGIVGLFSVWSLSGYNARTQVALSEVTVSMDQARRAQLRFKTQVQEWKNILLRGHVLNDRIAYIAAFEKEKASTLELLEGLRLKVALIQKSEGLIKLLKTPDSNELKGVSPELEGEVEKIIASLTELNEAYKEALDETEKNGIWDPRTADVSVRGFDRKLNERIDAVPVELERAYGDLVSLSTRAAEARFEILTRVVWVGVIFALSLVAFMLWRMLKHPALVK